MTDYARYYGGGRQQGHSSALSRNTYDYNQALAQQQQRLQSQSANTPQLAQQPALQLPGGIDYETFLRQRQRRGYNPKTNRLSARVGPVMSPGSVQYRAAPPDANRGGRGGAIQLPPMPTEPPRHAHDDYAPPHRPRPPYSLAPSEAHYTPYYR